VIVEKSWRENDAAESGFESQQVSKLLLINVDRSFLVHGMSVGSEKDCRASCCSVDLTICGLNIGQTTVEWKFGELRWSQKSLSRGLFVLISRSRN
jgi:hypothetical protein